MSTHVVTLPDGRKVKVQAPSDAEDEAIFSFALHSLILGETKAREKQGEEIEKLRADVRELLAEFREIGSRIERVESWIGRKQSEKPIIIPSPPAPVVKISPEVKVITDPSVAGAILAIGRNHDAGLEKMTKILEKVGAPPAAAKNTQPASPAPASWVFSVEHDSDPHSPRFGRMTRVIAKPA